jgi:hypothetical protein
MSPSLVAALVHLLSQIVEALTQAHKNGELDDMQAAEVAFEAARLAKFGPR